MFTGIVTQVGQVKRRLDKEKIAEGEGKSKQDAEQKAAERALEVKGWE